ncbi:chemotaxis protein CheW [Methylomagnum ishizawai]|uniref:chemotaxis protein CheW n=1 Tax=Methylomagnum ishizawai TaxID=1760988 RepID=UPI001C32EC6B|nr:chemotaxis protein CheW [Methylomagnum ishizawai]BBL75269.1 hypothetical protein MishRS11D_23670 [Methylomagnum ishizawai]
MAPDNAASPFADAPEWLPLMETLALLHAPAHTGAAAPAARFGFRTGGLGWLLPAAAHSEIVMRPGINPFPGTQPWFDGLLNLRGHLVPVFDLGRWLGATRTGTRHLLAIGRGERVAAVWSDGLPETLDAAPPPAPPARVPTPLRPYVQGGRAHGGEIWLEIHFETLFADLGSRIALE